MKNIQSFWLVLACSTFAVGCSDDKASDGDGTGTPTSGGVTSAEETTDGSGDEATSGETGDTGDTGDTAADQGETDEGTFVNNDSAMTCGTMCDPWTPGDCPEGEKCTAVACEVGSTSWDSNVCRPIGGDNQSGDECMGAGVDGNDDCADGLLCWDPNPDTGLGNCVEFCTGSPMAPNCTDGDWLCTIANNGVLPICLPECDPLAPNCPNPNALCLPNPGNIGFQCVLNASGDMGPYGAPCAFANSCNQGMICLAAAGVPAPECTGSDFCCTPICDISEPNQCPGMDQGQSCEAFFEEAPPGYENVGVCTIPG